MNSPTLTVTVKCRDNAPCHFLGKDLVLDVTVTNAGKAEVGFPLDFVKSSGPVTRLIDTRTKAENFVPTKPADFDLADRFTPIAPGRSVALEWIVMRDELEQFGDRFVDVTVEVTVMAGVQVDGKKVDFRGSGSVRVVSKDQR